MMRKSLSVASTWLPEGDGYIVFKTIPSGQPKLARSEPDHAWNRVEVENTVRAWMRHIPLNVHEMTRIKSQWNHRFEMLPKNGDIELLQDDLKLVWVDLPIRPVATSATWMRSLPLHAAGITCPLSKIVHICVFTC